MILYREGENLFYTCLEKSFKNNTFTTRYTTTRIDIH